MGKEAKTSMKASTFECEECGATVKVFPASMQAHIDVPCPLKMSKKDSEEGWTIPDYCKNQRKE